MAIGAAAMYILDPQGGRRRRKMALDQARALQRDAAWECGRIARNVAHHARGAVHEIRQALDHGTVGDDVLVERVRAELGRATSQARAIDVEARDGNILLTGQVLAAELGAVLSAVSGLRGVTHVDNRLEVRRSDA
ncbi:MAG TPA: BON domain-containing protein [Vicinamibacteria bacterium]|nr:BON domain-containing protein [Vicinamibacteria bacterium]